MTARDIQQIFKDFQRGLPLNEKFLRDILHEFPQNDTLIQITAITIEQLHGPQAAHDFLLQYIHEHGDNANRHLTLCAFIQQLFPRDILLANYRYILKNDPTHIQTILAYIQALKVNDKNEQALEWVGKGLNLLSDNDADLTHKMKFIRLSVIFKNRLRRHDENIKDLKAHIKTYPDNRKLQHLLGLEYLSFANFSKGWPYYLRHQEHKLAHLQKYLQSQPWPTDKIFSQHSTIAENQSLAIVGVCGAGDIMQFIRYLPALKKRVRGRIIGFFQPALHPLFANLNIFDAIYDSGDRDKFPPCDYHLDAIALPLVVGEFINTELTKENYFLDTDAPLAPKKDILQKWQKIIQSHTPNGKIPVAFAWTGNPKNNENKNREIPPNALLPLLKSDKYHFFSIQVGARTASTEDCLKNHQNVTDLAPLLTDFQETAATILAVDRVVSIETSVAHLSASMGQKTDILLAKYPCWRWGRDGGRSKWYPTATLYRQEKLNSWQEPVNLLIKNYH